MKKNILLLLFLMVAKCSAAQKSKEEAPTQAEMQQMMKEMQQELDNMSPDDKKMMDSMGIKMPDINKIKKDAAGINNAQLKQAYEDDDRIVPNRDAARIAAIPKGVTEANIKNYIAAIHKKITPLQDEGVAEASDAIYAWIEKEKINEEDRGNAAMGFWAAGHQRLALFLLGKICAYKPSANDLNNYASMLAMMGGEHLAIPILENLDNKIPGNIILLNNLAQAWFGLGEITKAEKYLDKVIAVYPYHPQANFTKAEIAESRGETNNAIDALKKSIQHAYTDEKENKLKKLGYKLKIEDVRLPFKPDVDPLLLNRFKRPDYPKSVDECNVLKTQWESFSGECEKEIEKLTKELKTATEKYNESIKRNTVASLTQLPLFAKKAALKMNERKSFFDLKMKELMQKFNDRSADLEKIKKERKNCVPEAPCTCHKNAESEYLKNYNKRKQPYDEEALKYYRQYYGEMVFWSQYSSIDDNQFEIVKLNFLVDFLRKLCSFEFKPEFSYSDYKDCKEEKEVKPFKLAEWDFSSNCKYKAEINYALIKQQINCSHTTTTIDAEFLKNHPVVGMGVKYTWVDVGTEFERSTLVLTPKLNISTELLPLPVSAGIVGEGTININKDKTGKTDWNAVVRAGIELGAGKSIGPVKAKATISESVEFEFDNAGLKDVRLVTEAKIKTELNLPNVDKANPENKDFNAYVDNTNKAAKLADMNVKIGVEDSVSLISSHGSVKGKGVLKKVVITSW